MTGKDSEKLIRRLVDDGWKKSTLTLHNENFYYYKAFEEYEIEGIGSLNRYQILMLFYDWRTYCHLVPECDEVSVNVIVMPMDLMDDGRVDLTFTRFDSITGVERIAREYYEWVRRNFKCRDR